MNLCRLCPSKNTEKVPEILKVSAPSLVNLEIHHKHQPSTCSSKNSDWLGIMGILTSLLMEEIPNNHLGCIKPCKSWDLSTGAGFLPSTTWPYEIILNNPHVTG